MERRLAAAVAAFSVISLVSTGCGGDDDEPSSLDGRSFEREVSPGDSIQEAVNAAVPGDTVIVAAGTYRESIEVTTDDITIRGAGSGEDGTVLVPPEAYPDSRCAATENGGALAGGVCFMGEYTGVEGPGAEPTSFLEGGSVSGLRIEGFPIGVRSVATDGVTVSDVTTVDTGRYGIVNVISRNGTIEGNVTTGSRHAGIFVGSYGVADSNTVVSGNEVIESAIGISTYDSQGVELTGNTMQGNCVGYLAFNDSLRLPGGDDIVVRDNVVEANNQSTADPGGEGCAAIEAINHPAVEGSGIVLVGSQATSVEGNTVTGNVGPGPWGGGIVVTSAVPHDPEADDEAEVTVSDNELSGNGPTDLVWDGLGDGVSFTGNTCATSAPEELCAAATSGAG